MEVNGDAFIIKYWGENALVGIIDGLGHGPHAHQAAETARQFVEAHYDQSLDTIFFGVDRACRATRGVVMALARFEFGNQKVDSEFMLPENPPIHNPHSEIKLTFASIGDIEARIFGNLKPMNFIIRRGVLGGSTPKVVVTEHPWRMESIMVLHSDGLKTHWQWRDFPNFTDLPAAAVAQQLLSKLAREEDDATVIVVKSKVIPESHER